MRRYKGPLEGSFPGDIRIMDVGFKDLGFRGLVLT